MGYLKIHAPIQDIAAVWEALTGLADAAKTPGDERTLGQRRIDVFTDIFHSILDRGGWQDTVLATEHGRRPHIGLLVPMDILAGAGHRTTRADGPANGDPRGGVSELVGYGPITHGQARKIAAEGTWRRLVCDPLSGTLLDYGTTRYHPPESLKQFVVTRDQECGWFGCSQPAWRSQIDHAQPFSRGGPTDEANLSALCHHHHRAKDGGGYRLTINSDRSKTWTTPLGRTATTPPTRLVDLEPAAPEPGVNGEKRRSECSSAGPGFTD